MSTSSSNSRRNILLLTADEEEQRQLLKPNKSFSVIFRGARRTLDLMVHDEDHRDVILDALDSVLVAYQEAKVKVAKDVLLLRYVWLDVDKVCVCVFVFVWYVQCYV